MSSIKDQIRQEIERRKGKSYYLAMMEIMNFIDSLPDEDTCKDSLHIPETSKENQDSFTYTFDVPDNDGFLVFTPMENRTIRKVLKLKNNERVTLTIRKYENNKI